MCDVRKNYASHQLITSSMRTHEKRVRFMRHTQQRQHRNHMISKYTMYQQHEITHYGQHKTRLLKKDTKPHKSYKIYMKIIQDDDIGENKDGAKNKYQLENIHDGV